MYWSRISIDEYYIQNSNFQPVAGSLQKSSTIIEIQTRDFIFGLKYCINTVVTFAAYFIRFS